MFERRKLKPCAPIDHKTLNTTSETFCTNSTPYAYGQFPLTASFPFLSHRAIVQIPFNGIPRRLMPPHNIAVVPALRMNGSQPNPGRCNPLRCRPSLPTSCTQSAQHHLPRIWISPCPHHRPLPRMTLSTRPRLLFNLISLAVRTVRTIWRHIRCLHLHLLRLSAHLLDFRPCFSLSLHLQSTLRNHQIGV